MASGRGDTEVVKLLLENGGEVNVKTTYGELTALMFASQEGHTEIVTLLLERGADVNVKSGRMPLFKGGEDAIAESRPKHLSGKDIVIAESEGEGEDRTMTFYWDRVFKNL